MPQGDKSRYTDKQKRKAQHIADSYEERGVDEDEAAARAWATVNKESGGGNKSGSGRGRPDTAVSARRGGTDRRRSIRATSGGRSIGRSKEGLGNAAAQGCRMSAASFDRLRTNGRRGEGSCLAPFASSEVEKRGLCAAGAKFLQP